MSNHTVESFLYRLGNDEETLRVFLNDPKTALARFNFTDEERRQLLEWDLHAIVDTGVSPMALMLGYFAAHGGHGARDQYVNILKGPRPA